MSAKSPAATVVLALAWLSTRVIAGVSVDMTPWMLHDVEIYRGWSDILGSGTFPASDPTWQYPPGIAPLFVAMSWLPLDPRWAFALLILTADAALMASLLLAWRRRPGASALGPWIWAMAGVIIGPIMVVRFDVVPTLFAVLAVLLAARPWASGAAAGLGALTKVWPALMLLVLPRRSLTRGLAAFAAVGAVGLALFALLTTGSLSFLGNQQARGLQIESVGALPYLLWAALGGTVHADLEYGSIQVLMAGAPEVGLVISLAGALVLAGLLWARLAGRLEAAAPGDVALGVILVSLATSRVNSPQFNTWLVGLAAAAALTRSTRMRPVIIMVILMSVITQVVYPWSATQLSEGGPVIVAVQAMRILLLVAATVTALTRILTTNERKAPLV